MADTPEQAAARKELAEITAASGNLGQQIESNPLYQATFGMSLEQVEAMTAESHPIKFKLLSGYRDEILPRTIAGLQEAIDKARAKGTNVLVNGSPATSAASALAGATLSSLKSYTVGPEQAYVERLQAIIDGKAPTAAAAPIATPTREPVRVNAPPAAIPPEAAVIDTALRPVVNGAPEVVPDPAAVRSNVPPVVSPVTRPNVVPAAQRVPLSPQQTPPRDAAPLQLGRITPQTTVLDLIVNGIQTSNDPEAAILKKAATEKLTDEIKKSKPELADNPQGLAAALQQGLPNSIRGIILDLSKEKAIQQKIAGGFLDAMRAQSPGAEQSGFYQTLKRLSSNEQTFPQFLNTNMLDGITKDYEARARAENGGTVPNRVIDAVAGNIMRVKPEIKKYNDAVGQDINDFVRNPQISSQRILHSPSTQARIRKEIADRPISVFFARLIGINVEKRAQAEALEEIKKRGVKDKNYSREIQSGFVDEMNRRTTTELRGEQLENMRAFTRHLSQLPYSRFIQEDISPRRVSSIILGIERPGEDRTPSRHLIPQHIASRPNPHVNVANAEPARATQTQQQLPARPAAPQSTA